MCPSDGRTVYVPLCLLFLTEMQRGVKRTKHANWNRNVNEEDAIPWYHPQRHGSIRKERGLRTPRSAEAGYKRV